MIKVLLDFPIKKSFTTITLLLAVLNASIATSPINPAKSSLSDPVAGCRNPGYSSTSLSPGGQHTLRNRNRHSSVFNTYNNYFLLSTLDLAFYRNLKISYFRILNGKKHDFALAVPVTIGLKTSDNAQSNFYFPRQKIAALGLELYTLKKMGKYSALHFGIGTNYGIQAYTLPTPYNTIVAGDERKIEGYFYDVSFRIGYLIQTKSRITFSFGIGFGWAQDLTSYYNYDISGMITPDTYYINPCWISIGLPVSHSKK